MPEKEIRELIGSLRNTIVVCAAALNWHEKKKLTQNEAFSVLKKGIRKAEKILKELSVKANL